MTYADDIEKMQILLVTEDKEYYITTVRERAIINAIVANCRFFPIKGDGIVDIALSDIVKQIDKKDTKL